MDETLVLAEVRAVGPPGIAEPALLATGIRLDRSIRVEVVDGRRVYKST